MAGIPPGRLQVARRQRTPSATAPASRRMTAVSVVLEVLWRSWERAPIQQHIFIWHMIAISL
jgi:hypothetical protein